jgi:glycosyltransferase involved in cell wall biosynthesis
MSVTSGGEPRPVRPDRPRVTIGMPVYNGKRFLGRSLESLLGQTFSGFELIISDNASTDGTAEICAALAARDPRIRYIRQPENRGSQANFNVVLQEACGEYFMWAAADDEWDPDYVETLVRFLDANRDYVGAFGQYTMLDSEGRKAPVVSRLRLERDSALARVVSLARHRDDRFVYGLFRKPVLGHAPFRPWRIARRSPVDGAFPLLFRVVSAGKVKLNLRTRFYYRVWSSSASAGQLSGWISLVIKANLLVGATRAVWQGSRSPTTAILAVGPIGLYQARSLIWYLVGGGRIVRGLRALSARRGGGTLPS